MAFVSLGGEAANGNNKVQQCRAIKASAIEQRQSLIEASKKAEQDKLVSEKANELLAEQVRIENIARLAEKQRLDVIEQNRLAKAAADEKEALRLIQQKELWLQEALASKQVVKSEDVVNLAAQQTQLTLSKLEQAKLKEKQNNGVQSASGANTASLTRDSNVSKSSGEQSHADTNIAQAEQGGAQGPQKASFTLASGLLKPQLEHLIKQLMPQYTAYWGNYSGKLEWFGDYTVEGASGWHVLNQIVKNYDIEVKVKRNDVIEFIYNSKPANQL